MLVLGAAADTDEASLIHLPLCGPVPNGPRKVPGLGLGVGDSPPGDSPPAHSRTECSLGQGSQLIALVLRPLPSGTFPGPSLSFTAQTFRKNTDSPPLSSAKPLRRGFLCRFQLVGAGRVLWGVRGTVSLSEVLAWRP